MFLKNNNLSKKLILDILDLYQQQNPSEKINRYLPILKKSDQSIISRKNFAGHITVSAFVIDPTLSKLLLVYHKNLKKYLQPGGHVENNDKSLWLAALRELEEETGIKDVFLLPKDESNPEIPLDIDIHRIPKNPQKNEPSHLHFDFGYLFLANKDNEWKINKKEITSLTWKNIDELEKENIPDKFRLIKKIKKLILKRRDFIFFNEIIKKFSINLKDVKIVAVLHIVPDILSFVDILKHQVKKILIIPKKNSINENTLSKIPKEFIFFTTRENLKKETVLEKVFSDNEKTVIIDIGGYFATEEFINFNKKKRIVLGIVEDTENGHLKYEKIKNNLHLPIISVARSQLKRNEDDLVGYSIGFYTEWVIRKMRQIPKFITCGIIGYGKIGKSIANFLFNQNIKPLVYDIDPIKLVEALKDGAIFVRKKDEVLENNELIFCATGNNSLSISDFLKIRPGCYIASVTSSDDEFDLSKINRYFTINKENEMITKYENENTYFYLINNGNAVNFIDKEGDRVSDLIRLVQAEILVSLGKIVKSSVPFGIHQTSIEEKRKIAALFLDYYCQK